MTTQTYTDGVTLTAAAEFNEFDTAAYAYLTGVAGTNTITGTGPANFTYAAHRMLRFTPAVTNTGATTVNVTPSGGAALGAKSIFFDGAALSGGELVAGVECIIVYDGTQFSLVGPTIGTRITNALSGDVAMNNTGNYFDGPSVAQGSVGTWFVSGTVTVFDTAGASTHQAKLWDGTSVIASAQAQSPGANQAVPIALSGYITSPAGNLRISVKAVTATTGKILFNNTGNSKDSTIFAVRVG